MKRKVINLIERRMKRMDGWLVGSLVVGGTVARESVVRSNW
jgi:hypothetical protein